MARSEKDQLIVELEARVRDFERGMQRAAGTADKQFGKINRSAKQSALSMQKTMQGAVTRVNGVLSKLGIAGLAGGGVAGTVAAIAGIAKEITATGDAARRAGTDFRTFQQLSYVARVNRIEVDKLTDGVKELQLRGSEFFTTGSGSAAEAFKALGYSADEVREKLKKPSEFLTEILGKLGQLDKASQINMADKLFGGSAAEDFVRLVDQGADGLRRTVAEAEAVGSVYSDNVLKKAQELDGLIVQASDTVGKFLKRAIIEAAWELARFIDSWREFTNQRTSTLQSRVLEIDKERLKLEREILETKHEQSEITENARDLGFGEKTSGVYAHDAAAIKAIQDRIDALSKEGAEIEEVLAKRKELETPSTPPPSLPPPGGGGGGGGTSRSKVASEAERERKAVDDLISSLELELSLVGSSNVERDIATTLRRANVDAASAEGRQIAALVTAIEAETEALEKAKQAKEELIQAGEAAFGMIGEALTSVADGSVKAEDAVKKLAVQLALAAAQAALLGSGPLAGLFGGGLFGGGLKIPGFASGTDYAPGGLAVVGEKGPELIQLPRGSKVFPNVPAVNGAGGGGAVNVTINQQIDASGADPAAIQRLEGGLVKMNRDLESRIVAGVRKAQKSNVKLG